MILVKNEMGWTINCFRQKEEMWKKMAEGAKGEGHRAYALKQSWSWERWAKTAEATFRPLQN